MITRLTVGAVGDGNPLFKVVVHGERERERDEERGSESREQRPDRDQPTAALFFGKPLFLPPVTCPRGSAVCLTCYAQ